MNEWASRRGRTARPYRRWFVAVGAVLLTLLAAPAARASAAGPGSGSTGGGPIAVVSWGANRLDLFGKGVDTSMRHQAWDGSAWQPSQTTYDILGYNLADSSAGEPDVVSWGPNRMDAFLVSHGALYHKAGDGSSWWPDQYHWDYLGDASVNGVPNLDGTPATVSWGPKRLDVFVRGLDGALYYKWMQDGSSWQPSQTGFEYLGGDFTGAPSVVSWGTGRIDVFVRGVDGALWHKWFDGSSWLPSKTDFESLGGGITDTPAAVSWGVNRLDVFVRGTDGGVWHKSFDGSSWQPSKTDFEPLGGSITDSPSVVSWGPNRLDVLVRGVDGGLWHKWFDGSSWQPSVNDFEPLGTPPNAKLVGAPSGVSWGPNRIDVFVLATDKCIYHKSFSGSSWTGYDFHGGDFIQ